MVLRFEVNQAEAFRRGVNVPKSTCHLEVDPASLSQDDRDLIADRLVGIDICYLDQNGNKTFAPKNDWERNTGNHSEPTRILANLPTYEALMEAIRENDRRAGSLIKIQTVVKLLEEMAKESATARVFLVENGKAGQWPVNEVRLECDRKNPTYPQGIGMALLAFSTEIGGDKREEFTVKSLSERLADGWPSEGEIYVKFLPEDAKRRVRKIEWRDLVELADSSKKERVVAIVF